MATVRSLSCIAFRPEALDVQLGQNFFYEDKFVFHVLNPALEVASS